MLYRRTLLLASGISLVLPELMHGDTLLREETLGDPDGATEEINLSVSDIARIEDLTLGFPDGVRDESVYPVVDKETLFRVFTLKAAAGEADAAVSRSTNKDRVTEYMNLFSLAFADPRTGKPYAFCACGLSWAICKAYCDLCLDVSPSLSSNLDYRRLQRLAVFRSVLKDVRRNYIRPHPQVEVMAQDARDRGVWVGRGTVPEPGWIVFYSWSGGSRGEHIGIVESASSNSLKTIEFNTTTKNGSEVNGGVVAHKDRSRNLPNVLGYAKTY